jgi:hypothetical protein
MATPDLGRHDGGSPADRIRRQAVEDRLSLDCESCALSLREDGLRAVAQLTIARRDEHDAPSPKGSDELRWAHPIVPQSSVAWRSSSR